MRWNRGYAYRETVRGLLGEAPTALAYLARRFPHATEAEWAGRFVRGEVELDGRIARADDLVRNGQVLVWHRPPWQEEEVPRTFGVIHEDAALVVVDKPSGLPTLPSGGFLENTLLSLVRERWPEAAPAHRLGRATSGLVVFTRTKAAAARLSAAFRDHLIDKRYRALASGVAGRDLYEIDAPIGLVPHPRLGQVHGATAEGKPSRSTARVLERREAQTLFEVRIHSGRPEQIRIHLAWIGHPLWGDPLFAAGGLPKIDAPGLPGDGGYLLHAEQITFAHPVTSTDLRLHCPPPPPLRCADEVAPLTKEGRH